MITFKKIASVLSSAAMLTSTVALAAAANYPAPFVQGGTADIALVWGTNAANTDVAGVTTITNSLNSYIIGGDDGTGDDTSIDGEAAPLFTEGTRLYINDTLSTVKSVVTKSATDGLPVLLADGSFSGNVDATYTQTIDIGVNPQLIFAGKQPTSDLDPQFLVSTSTTTANYIYNATVTFSKAVNLSHADSKGQDLTLFGQKFTIAAATDGTDLVLLKTAEKVSLTSDDPSAEVTIGGKTYTVELVSASDTAATVKVTNSEGVSDTKEVSENASKKINGITIAVTNADETNFKLSANIIAGAEKVTLSGTQGSSVTMGEEATVIDGTSTTITGGIPAATKIVVSVRAPNSDEDAIVVGTPFQDPVFGSFKIDFTELNIEDIDSTNREDMKFSFNGDDKMEVTFANKDGISKSIQYAINWTAQGPIQLQRDSDGHNITVMEKQNLFKDDYVVVGNEESGRLIRISQISNSTTAGTSGDKVQFTDVFSGDTIDTTITSDGVGTVSFGGKVYDVKYNGTSSDSSNWATLGYPDSSGAGVAVVYPTIQTSKGAKLAFYEPLNLSLSNWDGDIGANALSSLSFPDGDSYTSVSVTTTSEAQGTNGIATIGGNVLNLSVTTGSVTATIGTLTYNFTSEGGGVGLNNTVVYLKAPDGANIRSPAIIIFEEKDDNSLYQAIVITTESGGDSNDGIGVDDIRRTWQADGTWDAIALASNSKMTKEADLYGTIGTVDQGDSDQYSAVISYPDQQIYAKIYVASDETVFSGGSGGGTGGSTNIAVISDSEIASVASKNLIVVGGSCVNSVASDLLGSASPLCGSDFTAKTGVGANQFLIETFARSGGKVATLVAGYNAADTTNAVKYLTTQTVDTGVGKKYLGTSATEAQLVTEESGTGE